MGGAVTPIVVEKVLHINQVVVRFEEANHHYEKIFAARKYMDSYDEGENRDASLLVVGDTCIELFGPRDATSLLGRTLDRYGPGFHSFEWKVPDLEVAKAALDEWQIRTPTYRSGSFLMTHPRDCHGLLIELCPLEMNGDPRRGGGWSSESWRTGPLGLARLNVIGAAVVELEAASAFVVERFGAKQLYHEHRRAGNVVGLWVGDAILELVEPSGGEGPVAEFLERLGPRLRTLVFRVMDLGRTVAHLEQEGLRLIPGDTDGMVAIDPADNFGALWQFTEDSVPNDPRD